MVLVHFSSAILQHDAFPTAKIYIALEKSNICFTNHLRMPFKPKIIFHPSQSSKYVACIV